MTAGSAWRVFVDHSSPRQAVSCFFIYQSQLVFLPLTLSTSYCQCKKRFSERLCKHIHCSLHPQSFPKSRCIISKPAAYRNRWKRRTRLKEKYNLIYGHCTTKLKEESWTSYIPEKRNEKTQKHKVPPFPQEITIDFPETSTAFANPHPVFLASVNYDSLPPFTCQLQPQDRRASNSVLMRCVCVAWGSPVSPWSNSQT